VLYSGGVQAIERERFSYAPALYAPSRSSVGLVAIERQRHLKFAKES